MNIRNVRDADLPSIRNLKIDPTDHRLESTCLYVYDGHEHNKIKAKVVAVPTYLSDLVTFRLRRRERIVGDFSHHLHDLLSYRESNKYQEMARKHKYQHHLSMDMHLDLPPRRLPPKNSPVVPGLYVPPDILRQLTWSRSVAQDKFKEERVRMQANLPPRKRPSPPGWNSPVQDYSAEQVAEGVMNLDAE